MVKVVIYSQHWKAKNVEDTAAMPVKRHAVSIGTLKFASILHGTVPCDVGVSDNFPIYTDYNIMRTS